MSNACVRGGSKTKVKFYPLPIQEGVRWFREKLIAFMSKCIPVYHLGEWGRDAYPSTWCRRHKPEIIWMHRLSVHLNLLLKADLPKGGQVNKNGKTSRIPKLWLIYMLNATRSLHVLDFITRFPYAPAKCFSLFQLGKSHGHFKLCIMSWKIRGILYFTFNF